MDRLTKLDVALLGVATWLVYKLVTTIRRRLHTTRLNGPPASSWLYGVSKEIFVGDSGALYEGWMDEYGPVFQVPTVMGSRRTMLCDPRAIAHFFARETNIYMKNSFAKALLENIVGRGILWADGDIHRRQRRALTPAFSVASIRNLTPVFYDSGYKVKAAWDNMIESSPGDEAIIDVQRWMNCVSLDSVGAAGFSHSFGSLDGQRSEVAERFEAFNTLPPRSPLALAVPLLAPIFPFLIKLPTARSKLSRDLHASMAKIAKVLMSRSRSEKDEVRRQAGISIIGALVKAENAETGYSLSEEEVIAQMNVLMLAGYETTSVSLTWALIELSRNPKIQAQLREELTQFAASDPTYDQIMNGLPYLDAVTREVLRLHSPVTQTTRVAGHDDIIPLSAPIKTSSGEVVDRLHIAKGTNIGISIRCMNCATGIWGPDAKEFKPERWLDNESGLPARAKEIQGYHHLLTFIDGPRTCLGKGFALSEFKTVLSVLVRNFAFEMRDGPDTKIDTVTTIVMRPKVAGEEGAKMPLRVRKVEH